MEVWKEIPNYEGLYEASNKGKIRSMEGKKTYSKAHGTRIWGSRILKEKNKNSRYERVGLWKDNEVTVHTVHTLVCKTFLDNTENKTCVNHIDGNKRNNHLDNLEWATHSENEIHSLENGLANTNINVTLIDKETGKKKEFRSMATASLYMGRSIAYISYITNKKKYEADGYKIKIDDRRS